jgi:DNA-binding transcriptional ArsR family regulator
MPQWSPPALSPSRARVRSTIAAAIAPPEDLRQLRLFHKAMADVNRLRIVRRLVAGEATVTELTDHVGLSQPLVSWHLGRLRAAGVVETRRQGRETVCRLRSEAFAEFAARERAILGFAG